MYKFLCCLLLLQTLHAQEVKVQKVPLGTEEKEDMSEQQELQYFTQPGVITYSDGKWIGSDRLFNLPKNINIIVERVRTKGSPFVVDKDQVVKNVEEILKKAGFTVSYLKGGPNLPLPLYHILITSMLIPDGMVANVDVRFFEPVQLSRDVIPQGIYWQAITWERETFIEDSKEKISEKVYEILNKITNEFTAQVKRANEMRKQLE